MKQNNHTICSIKGVASKGVYEGAVQRAIGQLSNQRTREILNLRFGLRTGRKSTLEAIGQKYGITRERVRQVENVALSDLKKPEFAGVLKPAFKSVDNFLDKEGGIVKEARLLDQLAQTDKTHPARGAVFFVLTMGEQYQRFADSDKFYSVWSNSKSAFDKASGLIDVVIQKIDKPIALNNILKIVREVDSKVSTRILNSYLDAAKGISQSNFGLFGLAHWPEINPRGARDKAYIVLKKQSSPLHFREVADLINQAKLGPNLAQAQTVHNELIKDDRFVLVGRGTYALKEWGYPTGTVKDILKEILQKSKRALGKDEIVEKVLDSRVVRENTILINLQDRKTFARNQKGKYTLVR